MYMGKALYREYRPRSLAEVAGQPHITGALERSLKSGKISHAFLFTGPRGVGKTSVARILAYQVNDLPYEEASNHLDIIEIDAASNRGIEDVRELRDKVAMAPTSAKYKVYIIDEVHMLTTPAFNALLKTLEEPPAHVIFILATTEAHKVPETIISRTQHYAFKPINDDSIVSHLRNIAEAENITIDDEALTVLAAHGGGSFRDSIGLLDQVRHSSEKITADDVRAVFGIAPVSLIHEIIDAIANHDTSTMFRALTDVREQGITASSLASQLSREIRNNIRTGQGALPRSQALELLDKLIGVAPSPNPEISLEVILVGASLEDTEVNERQSTAKPKPVVKQQVITPEPAQKKELTVRTDVAKKVSEETVIIEETPVTISTKLTDTSFDSVWQEALIHIKKSHHSLYGVLRMAEASLRDEQVYLIFRFKLHYSKVNDLKNRDIIATILKQITGKDYGIRCSIADSPHDTSTVKAAEPEISKVVANQEPIENEALSTISNIFGGGELLES